MKPLSPKKYIETKVRLLPVYKCLVNSDWQVAGMANLIVMRRHVNGNVSGGMYLVDLKCLGVKDSFWFFNELEKDMMEKFTSPGLPLISIDYNLAHNIVYAGYDFAMEYDIHPNKEFAVSRFVLEEDTDDIPLIDIETGYNGMPHLFVHEPGQYADALAKLRKNAGEGNYRYTMAYGGNGMFDEDEENDFDDEDNIDNDEGSEPLRLSEIPIGNLNLLNVQQVELEDLFDKDLVSSRNLLEQRLCQAALAVRCYKLLDNTQEEETSFIDQEWNMFDHENYYGSGMDADSYDAAIEQGMVANSELMKYDSDNRELQPILEKHLRNNKDNPLFICLQLEVSLLNKDEHIRSLLQPYTEPFRQLPLVQLLLALKAVIHGEPAGEWQQIMEARHSATALPQLKKWGDTELLYFWAIQTVRHVQEGKLALAVAYYDLISAVEKVLIHVPLLFAVYKLLVPALNEAVQKGLADKKSEDNSAQILTDIDRN